MITVESINYYKPHWHDTILEFAMVLSGSIDAATGPDSYRMRDKNILLTGAGKVHSFKATNEENLVLLIRIDSADWMNIFPGIMEWELIADPAVEESNSGLFGSLKSYMLSAALSRSRLGICGESRKALHELLGFCRDRFLPSGIMMHEEKINEAQIETFMKLNSFVRRNLSNDILISNVSDFIGFSRNHTAYVVKQMTGLEFPEYIRYLRCLEAEKLLLSTEATISEISDECGFADLRDFTASFRKRYHNPPEAYRDLIKLNYPDKHPVSTDPLDLSSPSVQAMLEPEVRGGNDETLIDPGGPFEGTRFIQPRFGIPDDYPDNDDIDALSLFIEKIAGGTTGTVKQTDDKGTAVFNGDCGLVTHTGISKPVFYIYDFMTPVRTIIRNESGLLITATENSIRIILYAPANRLERKRTEKLRFKTAGKNFTVKKYTIDSKHGNPHYYWDRLGRPPTLSKENEEMIIRHSLPQLDISAVKNRITFDIEDKIPAEGAVLIDISPAD